MDGLLGTAHLSHLEQGDFYLFCDMLNEKKRGTAWAGCAPKEQAGAGSQ